MNDIIYNGYNLGLHSDQHLYPTTPILITTLRGSVTKSSLHDTMARNQADVNDEIYFPQYMNFVIYQVHLS